MLELAGIRVDARSVGGIETAIDLPDWKVCLDVGRAARHLLRRELVLFTHAHVDHLGGIAYHTATRSLLGMRPPTYVVPAECVEPLGRLFEAWRDLDRSEMRHTLVPLRPGESHAIRRDLRAEAFAVSHTVPSQGYLFVQTKKSLDPRFAGRSQRELAQLARAGERIDTATEVPELAFCGDTRIEGLDAHPDVRRARVLILECTFLDDRVPRDEARACGHVHVDEVAERADWFENERILLTHFSSRYRREEIETLLVKKLPARLLDRVVPLLPDPDAGRD
ncbi:MAG: MBL fold metallo-hydrolase [Planctomycetota bacterium]